MRMRKRLSGFSMDRVWAMPNAETFSIDPVARLINRYVGRGCFSVDPFARNSKFAKVTNDIDPSTTADFHMDALVFLKRFEEGSVDAVLYDPPYSISQVREVYRDLKGTVNLETTSASFWKKNKSQVRRVLKPGGLVVCCGWNSGGMGKVLGFELLHVLLICHGGPHNDTIVTVERKGGFF